MAYRSMSSKQHFSYIQNDEIFENHPSKDIIDE
jgi:hypothetical protein